MKATGIIAEFNPFHKGHAYILEQARSLTKADGVIVVLSGNFVQRGTPAVFDKWLRTRAALLGGADLVLELPLPWALASAEGFAAGGVALLEATGITESLCFGTESGDLSALEKTAALLSEETTEFRTALETALSTGLSYPAARSAALTELGADAPQAPNEILAVEYLKAIHQQHSRLQPLTVERKNDYHSTFLLGSFPSATALRHCLEKGEVFPEHTMPPAVYDLQSKAAPVFAEALAPMLQYRLRTVSPETLRRIADVTEGLENRILEAADHCTGFEESAAFIKSKRYSLSRIRRILCRLVLELEDDFPALPPYLRVLGVRQTALPLLGEISRRCSLPLITNPKRQLEALSEEGKQVLMAESRATDLYMSLTPTRQRGQEFSRAMVKI